MSATPASTSDIGQLTETRIQNPRTLWLMRLVWLVLVLGILSVALVALVRFIQHPMQSCLCDSIRLIDERDGMIVLDPKPNGPAANLMQNDDVLLAINGVSLPEGITPDGVYAFTIVYPPETPLTLTIRTGDEPERDITLLTTWPVSDFTAQQIIVLDIIQLAWFAGFAFFIAFQRSDDWMALFSSYILLAFGVTGFLTGNLGWNGGAWHLYRLVYNINGNVLPVFFLMVFPDGKLIPRWSLVIPTAFGIYNLLAHFQIIIVDPVLDSVIYLAFVVTFVLIPLYRYRNVFTPLRRQQTKWVLLGVALWLFTNGIISLLFSSFEILELITFSDALKLPLAILLYLMTLVMPLTAMFAILRYRLYDIDLVINRSLVYGAVTLGILAIFGIGFIITYIVTQDLFGAQYAVIPLVAGTLLSSVAFGRMRAAAQRFVDRRIYRLNFDLNQLAEAQKTLDVKNPGALTGKTIGGYEVLGVLGKGGMGEVYQGRASGQTVALKVLTEDLAQRDEFVTRFEREASAMRLLNHPNIVKLLSSGKQDAIHYLAMEYVEGTDLARSLNQKGKMTYEDACVLLRDLAAALDYAHVQGLVHRDIKSSNVMLRGEDPPQAVLMDFGIAKIKDAGTRYTGSGAIGTIDYMAPEQIMAAKEVDKRADIYALGVLAFEMITGEKPFKGSAAQVMFAHLQQPPPDPRDVAENVSRSVAHAIQRAMSKDPKDRHESAGEFAAMLA